MKSFLGRILVFGLILVVADQSLGFLLKANRPVDYKLFIDEKKKFFEDDKQYDVLIIGDSHTADAFDPRIIEAKTGLTAFNLGVYHATPYENYFMLKSAL